MSLPLTQKELAQRIGQHNERVRLLATRYVEKEQEAERFKRIWQAAEEEKTAIGTELLELTHVSDPAASCVTEATESREKETPPKSSAYRPPLPVQSYEAGSSFEAIVQFLRKQNQDRWWTAAGIADELRTFKYQTVRKALYWMVYRDKTVTMQQGTSKAHPNGFRLAAHVFNSPVTTPPPPPIRDKLTFPPGTLAREVILKVLSLSSKPLSCDEILSWVRQKSTYRPPIATDEVPNYHTFSTALLDLRKNKEIEVVSLRPQRYKLPGK